tara:strand:+ start:1604 stop:2461 length:858 start_codon:yes stop_codon:yes gene_type:complete
MVKLRKDTLETWVSKYNLQNVNYKVAIIMAGNFPLAGLHDLICVIITGNKAIIKPSSDDKILINFFVEYLHEEFPETNEIIEIASEKLDDFEKVIATGSNNTFNYFEYYFRDKSSLLRKNRNSIAVLSGDESENELKLLSDDIFIYFGLGCRNISKIFVPTGYDISQLKNKFNKYNYIINHNKYSNNYNYQKTIKIMNNEVFTDCDYFLMSQSKEINPPISVIYYDYYDDLTQVCDLIKEKRNQIQCIVTNLQIKNSIRFGEAQDPKLDQYADNSDTINFLLTSS